MIGRNWNLANILIGSEEKVISSAVAVNISTASALKEYTSSDNRLYEATKYEDKFDWLYFNHTQQGYKCKVCEIFYRSQPSPTGGSRGAWSHKAVIFNDNAGKKIRCYHHSHLHSEAVLGITDRRMEKALEISDDAKQRRAEANQLYMAKLVRIVHFLARHNLAVKELFTPMIEFLAFELEEPIMKQYLKTCPKNASYDSHQTCDSLVESINDYFQQRTDLKLQSAVDLVIYADESTSAARKEMMGIFISCFDEEKCEFALEYFQLVECASTDAAALLELISKTVSSRGIEINRTRFSCLDGTNTMSGHATGLQRRLCNLAPHAMYINCRGHRLALCFKHLMKQFPWLNSIDGLLLGLWKVFYYSGKKRHILKEIQLAYGQKLLYTVKAAVTRWLSHGKACKRCRERYLVYVEALDAVLDEGSDAKISSFRDDLLKPVTVMKISFMEDVLAVTNVLCLLLQSERKDFSAIQRALSFTVQKLDGMANDMSSRDLSSFQKSPEITTGSIVYQLGSGQG